MYYRIADGKTAPSDIEAFAAPEPGVGFLTFDEAVQYSAALGVDDYELELCRRKPKHFHAGIENRDGRSVILINAINRTSPGEFDRVAFLLRRDKLLLIQIEDADGSVKDNFEAVIKRREHSAAYEAVVYDLFADFLASGEDILDDTEEQISAMEEDITAGNLSKILNQRICVLRNAMSKVMRYYDELVDVGEALQADDNEIFDVALERFFKRFTDKAERLSETARMLSENLVHLRETLSAALDYNMNFTMKIFTVVSVIFMPLTLIVGWYGMNFYNMPELGWKYGYAGAFVLCIATVIVCIIYFKKKKYF